MNSTVIFLSGLPSHVTKDQLAFKLCLYGHYHSLELFEGIDGLVARVEDGHTGSASDDQASQLLG
jgi:hypothetical protein